MNIRKMIILGDGILYIEDHKNSKQNALKLHSSATYSWDQTS